MRKMLFGVLLAFCIPAAAQPPTSDALRQLIQVSGYDQAMQLNEEITRTDIAKEHILNPDNAMSKLEAKAYLKNLTHQVLLEKTHDEMQNKLSADDVAYLLDFYQQPLIAKMQKRIKASNASDFASGFLQFQRELPDNLPSPQRIQQIGELTDASMSVIQKVFMAATIARERARATLQFHDKFNTEERQKLDYHITRLKNAMEKNVRNETLLAYVLYLCDGFTDEELRQLVELYQDPKRVDYEILMTDALGNALAKGVNSGVKAQRITPNLIAHFMRHFFA